MKLSQEINDSINAQIVHELRNQNTYMQIACAFENKQLKNIAKYFMDASTHEGDHAKMFIKHLNDRAGGKVEIKEIPAPMDIPEELDQIGFLYVSLEEDTTENIESILDLVREKSSYIDEPFILHMLAEQVEEEDSANHFNELFINCKNWVMFDAMLDDLLGG